jgi:hypothetical protein
LGFTFVTWGVVFLGEGVGECVVDKAGAVKYDAGLVALSVLFHEFYYGGALGGDLGEEVCDGVFAEVYGG